MENTITQVLQKLKDAFGISIFTDPSKFKSALRDIPIKTNAKPIRNLLNIAICDMCAYSRLESAISNNNSFIIDNLASEMSLDYGGIDRQNTLIVINCIAGLLGYKNPKNLQQSNFLDKAIQPWKRELTIYFLLDVSSSMSGEKLFSINIAMRELAHELKWLLVNVGLQTYMRVMKFASGAQWHTNKTKIEDFKWYDLDCFGINDQTDTGAALRLMAQELRVTIEFRIPSVIILVTDGEATDDYVSGLKELLSVSWGKAATRMAIMMGAEANVSELSKFCSHKELLYYVHNDYDLRKILGDHILRWCRYDVHSDDLHPED